MEPPEFPKSLAKASFEVTTAARQLQQDLYFCCAADCLYSFVCRSLGDEVSVLCII